MVAARKARAPRFRAAILTISLATLAAAVVGGCTRIGFALANLPAELGPVQRVEGLAFGDLPRQRLDVYSVPVASAYRGTPRPVVVFWYGGGFTHGDRKDYRFVGAALAERGYVTVIPDYRTYPDVEFPQILEDPTLALAWVQAHAREFGGDPDRIVLMGHSAGAYFATFLAFDERRVEAAGIRRNAVLGVIGLSGPYALTPTSALLDAIFHAPYQAADWQPVRHVNRGDPPTLILHGTADDTVSVAHAEKLRDALKDAGVPVESEMYEGVGHADTIAAFAWGARGRAPSLERVTAFLVSIAP